MAVYIVSASNAQGVAISDETAFYDDADYNGNAVDAATADYNFAVARSAAATNDDTSWYLDRVSAGPNAGR